MNNQTDSNNQDLLIERAFTAPASRVWQAWSDAELVKRWWGPKGFTAPVADIDFREGGKYLFCMRSPEGKDFWSTGTYCEIVPQQRIVCTDSFADEQGNIVSAAHYGMSPDFPMELLVTITLEEQEGSTKLSLRHAGIPDEDKDMCADGWSTSLDKLTDIL